ncbi:transmembrane 9 superfamily member 3 [Musa acuminata AAA Group]
MDSRTCLSTSEPIAPFGLPRLGNEGSRILKMELSTLVLLVMACGLRVGADGTNHRYKEGDHVPLYANKVGPFHNPSETYRYYDLPFCSPEHVTEKTEALGEVLNGDRLVDAPYELNFLEEQRSKSLCKKNLSKEDVAKFRHAVSKDYYFEMYYDDLPLWGFLGKIEEVKTDSGKDKYFLFKHIHFNILYNDDRVIEINVQTDPNINVDISEDRKLDVEFLYSVTWKNTDISFEERMAKYSRTSSMPQHLEIHWFSIVNSCVTVLLLTGFLATILMRVLKNDFVKYSLIEESLEDQEDSGWKYIHGDVFRFPKNKSLFSAIIGSGTQLLVLTMFIFLLALVGVFYPYNRGALYTALVVIYALTSGIAGYTASSFYMQLEGTNWVRNLLLTGCLFCGPLFLTFFFLNTVAITYSATAALPFGTILVILLIWALVTSPLLILGGVTGKNSKTEFQAPCRTNKYPREIPELAWYRGTIPQMAMAGFLPFSAIYVELYYIFASVWGHKIYTIYSILFIVFIILIIVTAFITVALTYFQLAAEDHGWWWRSVLCGGSTGVFIFFYCIYYYHARSDMSGFMQTSFFFGYMTCICYGFFLMLGTVGFRASLLFVRHIYRSIKCE